MTMLGTLYGDLVACSFKQNGMKFGNELVREDAFFSDKGLLALATADALMIKDNSTPVAFKKLVGEYYYGRDKKRVHFPIWFWRWLDVEGDYKYGANSSMAIPMNCITAPIDNKLQYSLYKLMLDDKAAMYDSWIIGDVIEAFKKGATKEDALKYLMGQVLADYIQWGVFDENDPYNSLNSLITAWNAFEKANDYTETVLFAAEMSKNTDTRIVTMIAATFAEVYYKPDIEMFKFPKGCMEHYGSVLKKLKDIDSDPAVKQRIEMELVATHSFNNVLKIKEEMKYPKTQEEAFEILDAHMTDEAIRFALEIKDDEEYSTKQHFGLGLWIRNNWIYSKKVDNSVLLGNEVKMPTGESIPEALVFGIDADDLSTKFVELYHKHLVEKYKRENN